MLDKENKQKPAVSKYCAEYVQDMRPIWDTSEEWSCHKRWFENRLQEAGDLTIGYQYGIF